MSKFGLLSLSAMILVAAASFTTGAFIWFQKGQEVSAALKSQLLMHAQNRKSETRRKLEVLHYLRDGSIERAVQVLEREVKSGLNPPRTATLINGKAQFLEVVEAREAPTPAMLTSAVQYQTKHCAGNACLGVGP